MFSIFTSWTGSRRNATSPTTMPTWTLNDFLEYFNETYVSGTYRRIQRPALPGNNILPPVVIRHTPPQFPPDVWNVNSITLNERARTNNFCEAWNNGYFRLVGHKHPSFWASIEALRVDEAINQTYIIQNSLGNPPQKRVKLQTQRLQRRLQNLCLAFNEGRNTVDKFLNGVGHTIRLF